MCRKLYISESLLDWLQNCIHLELSVRICIIYIFNYLFKKKIKYKKMQNQQQRFYIRTRLKLGL